MAKLKSTHSGSSTASPAGHMAWRVACQSRQRWRNLETPKTEIQNFQKGKKMQKAPFRIIFSEASEYKETRLFLFKNYGSEMS